MSALLKVAGFRTYLADYAKSLKKPLKELTLEEVGAAEQKFLDQERLAELFVRLLPYLREELETVEPLPPRRLARSATSNRRK